MAKRIIRDEGEARRCLQAAGRSGQTVTAWAREQGIDGRSLGAWPRKLGQEQLSPSEAVGSRPRLVELVPKREPRRSPSYAVVVNDVRFEFGEEASASMLQRVVGALKSC